MSTPGAELRALPAGAVGRSGSALQRRERAGGARLALGRAGLGGLLVLGVAVALSAPASRFMIPAADRVASVPGWLAGPLAGTGWQIGHGALVGALVGMFVCYLAVLRAAGELSPRVALGAVLVLHLAFLLAPPLLSTDIFGYVDYARLGVLAHLNPYLTGQAAVPGDPAVVFSGPVWHRTPSVYGPLFTLLTYPLAPLGVAGAVWALKVLAATASLGCVALAWAGARARGRPPLAAALLVGLNPLILVDAVGGGHNDQLMALLVLAGAVLLLRGRERSAGVAVAGAVAIKATAGLALPFVVLGAGRWRGAGRVALGAAAGLAVGAGVGVAVFGPEIFHVLGTFGQAAAQHVGEYQSVPGFIAAYCGLDLLSPAARIGLDAALALTVAGALVFTLRHRSAWLAAATGAMTALLVLSATLHAWYLVWMLPLAAVSGDRRSRAAALGLTAALIAIEAVRWLAPAGLHYPHAG